MQQNPYLEAVHSKSDNVISYLAGGISNIYPSQFIQDDEAQDMYNMCLDNYPALRTRIGRTMLKNPGLKGEKIKYFGVAGVNYIFYIQGNTLKDMSGTAIATNITGDKFQHVYYADGNNEYLILYGNGIKPTRHKLPLSSVNTPEIMPLPKDNDGNEIIFEHMCYHKNRMMASKGNMLYFSGLQNPMDWTSTENSREDRVPNCQQITGLVSFDDKLIVFSQANMHLYYGSNVISGTSNSYSCVSLDNNIGCYDQNTIKVHNSYLYWLYGRNIYEYDGSTIRSIEKPTSNNGVTGGIQKYIYGITLKEAEKISVAASEDKIYFWFPGYNYFLVFDQRLRKWTRELQPTDDKDELYYVNICDSYNDLNFSQTPTPIYALTANGVIYEITGGRKDGLNYIQHYGIDEFTGANDVVYTKPIPFYFKSKEFKDGVLSKKKALSEIWFNYDLDGTVNIKITTNDGKEYVKENALPNGKNKTECILIPNEIQNVSSYTFEIYGSGDVTIYGMERKYRVKVR
jgi:hypothetical protein